MGPVGSTPGPSKGQGLAMGSTDYLNSARRAAIVFSVLAAIALSAASYRLAVTAWGAAPLALSPGEKLQGDRRVRADVPIALRG